ncbi:unnamed protein product [Phytomonas sp. Hart1]|nr:unnamed protein product [Phytomonas sp. Hart1]|eukprot:CCW67304.1 unnamed protein product [Phytomonas sp. isolate Hart1]
MARGLHGCGGARYYGFRLVQLRFERISKYTSANLSKTLYTRRNDDDSLGHALLVFYTVMNAVQLVRVSFSYFGRKNRRKIIVFFSSLP